MTGYQTTISGERVLVEGLWDYHFSVSNNEFNEKLIKFNDKIKTFRDTLQATGSTRLAYREVLSVFYGQYAMTRFFDKATQFAIRMKVAALSGAAYQMRYPLSSLADYYHIYLNKVTFDLENI